MNTTISISQVTRNRLAKLGKFGQSFDDLLDSLLKEVETK